jgi:Anti-sigma-K factor rskA
MADDELLGQRLEAALAGLEPDDLIEPPPPPPEIWDAIEAEVRAEAEAEARAAAEAEATASAGHVVPLAPRRRASPLMLGLVAAVVLLAVALAASLREPDDPEPQVAARADLNDELLTVTTDTVGDARLLQSDGELLLEVDLADLPPTPSGVVFEVWLIDPETGELQTLGLTEGSGQLVVPDGIDPARFSVVDVSREPVDGEPAHSGDSIVRGQLQPV